MSIVPYRKVSDKWETYKAQSLIVAEKLQQIIAHERIGDHKHYYQYRGLRMADCSTRIEYKYCPECGSLHISKTYLCRDRLCPVCNWRLSLQRIGQMMQSLTYLWEHQIHIDAAMLTLTVRNVPAQKLKDTIDHMLQAWQLLRKRRGVAKWVKGYARSIEITKGKDGTYHPHIHALLMFGEGYREHQITQREWAQYWQECLGVDYTPITDIRRAYTPDAVETVKYSATHAAGDLSSSDELWQRLLKATVEATKYTLKSDIAIDADPDELRFIADAIHSRMLISYGGIIRAARKALKMSDTDEAADIQDTAIECPKCGADTIDICYEWARSSYVLGSLYH